ncbi:MAG: hypothetical protein AAFQ99_02075, partial [Pseudomonadota bacterium]
MTNPISRAVVRIGRAATAVVGLLASMSAFSAPVTTLNVQNLESQSKSNTHLTFGHVFRVGEVASSQTLVATFSDGTAIPLQVDKKATHADGSLRHAILTLSIDALGSSANETVQLSTATGGLTGSAVTVT